MNFGSSRGDFFRNNESILKTGSPLIKLEGFYFALAALLGAVLLSLSLGVPYVYRALGMRTPGLTILSSVLGYG
jgi:hypothetical protein